MRLIKRDSEETDEVDDTLLDEEGNEVNIRQSKRRIRGLQLKKREMELQKQISEVKPKGDQTAVVNTGVNLVAMLASQGMEPAKANEYVKAMDGESMMKLSMLGGQNPNSLLPLILMSNRPGTSLEDILKTVSAIIAIAKPSGGDDSLMREVLTKTIPDLQKEIRTTQETAHKAEVDALNKRLDEMKPEDPVNYFKKFRETAEAFGMTNPATNVEIERMKLEDKREARKIELDGENTKYIGGLVTSLVEGRLGAVLDKVGGATADRIRSGQGALVPGGANQADVAAALAAGAVPTMVQCSNCAGTFEIMSNAKTASCPHCKTNLMIQPAQGPQRQPQQRQQQAEQPVEKQQQYQVANFGRSGNELTGVWSNPPESNEQEPSAG